MEKYQKYAAFRFAERIWIPSVLMFCFTSAPCIFTKFMPVPMKAMRMMEPKISYQVHDRATVPRLLLKNEPDVIFLEDKCATPLIKNYLDDIIGTKLEEEIAWKQFNNCKATLRRLSLNLQDSKTLPPTRRGVLLGALVDSLLGRVFLTPKKHDKYWFVCEQCVFLHPF